MRQRRELIFWSIAVFVILINGCSAPTDEPIEVEGPREAQIAPFLWKIEGEKTSYLYGTIHVTDERVLRIPTIVERAIDEVDFYYAETAIGEIDSLKALEFSFLPKDKTLRDVLPADVYKKLDSYLISKGISILKFSQLKVEVVVFFLIYLEAEQLETDYFLDSYLYEIALRKGKTVGGIETIEESSEFFNTLTADEKTRWLNLTLDDFKKNNGSELDIFIQSYLTGDEDELLESSIEEHIEDKELEDKIEKILLTDRNKNMANRIARKVKAGESSFFAFGAAHFLGEESVVALLKEQGLKVTRIPFGKEGKCDPPTVTLHGHCYFPKGNFSQFLDVKRNAICDDERITRSYVRDFCYTDLAMKNSDIAYCLSINESSSCLKRVAEKTRNLKDCAPLDAVERDTCYYRISVLSNNPKGCDAISSVAEHAALCYSYFAGKKDDNSFCSKIKLDLPMTLTFADTLENEDIINAVGMPYTEFCKSKYAKTYPSYPDWEFKEIYYLPDKCAKEVCLLDDILESKKLERCGELSESYSNICEGIKQKDTSKCGGDVQDICFLKFATFFKDIMFCENIKHEVSREKCFGTVAVAIG